MDDDGKLYLYTGFALQGNPLLLDGSKPTEHGAMCFELDPADMLTVKMGPKYIGIASEKEHRELLMRDIPSWRQAPCVNSMEPITSSTVP